MAGVIDQNGVQWEHCNICGKMEKIHNLGYLPNEADICLACTNKLGQNKIILVIPAKGWKKVIT